MDAYTLTHGPALIGLVPHLVGYRPEDSLVLVTAHSTGPGGGQVGASLRIDFGRAQAEGLDGPLLESLLAPLSHTEGADIVFPVLFSEALASHHTRLDEAEACGAGPDSTGPGGPDDQDEDASTARILLDGLEAVCAALDDRGLTVLAPLWAGRSECGRIGEPGSTPVAAAETAPAVIGMIAEGSHAADSFEDLVRPPRPCAEHAAEVERMRAGGEVSDEAAADALLRAAQALEERVRRREGGERAPDPLPLPEPEAVLALDRFAARPADRDFVQMLLSGDHPAFTADGLADMPERSFLAYARRMVFAPGATQALVGFSPRPPRLQALAEAVDWLRACMPYASAEALPGVHAVLAWFEWSRMRMRFAEHYARTALRGPEDCRLARLVLRAVQAGVPPEWAREHSHERDPFVKRRNTVQ
ncbi:DUF4192 family protein [Brevibacterium album]|uniref:DUF4192 family protein n=1 Tax=Brevibacterium album TaxID=417948 RepID=UPI0004295DC7|nr:DUF4192 family protein [Brevibacterium album]